MPVSFLRSLLASRSALPLPAASLLLTSGLTGHPRTPPSSRISPGTSPPRARACQRTPTPSAPSSTSPLRAPLQRFISTFTLAGDTSTAFRASPRGALSPPPRTCGSTGRGRYTLPAVLEASASLEGIGEGRQEHAVAAKAWVPRSTAGHVRNVTLYGACRDARRAFDEMAEQDVVLWTALSPPSSGEGGEALGVFAEMDVAPNEATLVTVLGACKRLGRRAVRARRAVHGWYVKRERELSLTVRNAVLDMYVKCEKLDPARWLFGSFQLRDTVSWTVMITDWQVADFRGEARQCSFDCPLSLYELGLLWSLGGGCTSI